MHTQREARDMCACVERAERQIERNKDVHEKFVVFLFGFVSLLCREDNRMYALKKIKGTDADGLSLSSCREISVYVFELCVER